MFVVVNLWFKLKTLSNIEFDVFSRGLFSWAVGKIKMKKSHVDLDFEAFSLFDEFRIFHSNTNIRWNFRIFSTLVYFSFFSAWIHFINKTLYDFTNKRKTILCRREKKKNWKKWWEWKSKNDIRKFSFPLFYYTTLTLVLCRLIKINRFYIFFFSFSSTHIHPIFISEFHSK